MTKQITFLEFLSERTKNNPKLVTNYTSDLRIGDNLLMHVKLHKPGFADEPICSITDMSIVDMNRTSDNRLIMLLREPTDKAYSSLCHITLLHTNVWIGKCKDTGLTKTVYFTKQIDFQL
jgi:hypothetical protein